MSCLETNSELVQPYGVMVFCIYPCLETLLDFSGVAEKRNIWASLLMLVQYFHDPKKQFEENFHQEPNTNFSCIL